MIVSFVSVLPVLFCFLCALRLPAGAERGVHGCRELLTHLQLILSSALAQILWSSLHTARLFPLDDVISWHNLSSFYLGFLYLFVTLKLSGLTFAISSIVLRASVIQSSSSTATLPPSLLLLSHPPDPSEDLLLLTPWSPHLSFSLPAAWALIYSVVWQLRLKWRHFSWFINQNHYIVSSWYLVMKRWWNTSFRDYIFRDALLWNRCL